MTKVSSYERFIDAVDRRASQLNREGYDYKAGFLESFLEGLAQTYPNVDGSLIAAARMLEEWADNEEASKRPAEVDIAM